MTCGAPSSTSARKTRTMRTSRSSMPPPPTTAAPCRKGTRRRWRRSSPPSPKAGETDPGPGEHPPRRLPDPGGRGGDQGDLRGLRPRPGGDPGHLLRPGRPYRRDRLALSIGGNRWSGSGWRDGAWRPSTSAIRCQGGAKSLKEKFGIPAYGFTSITGLAETDLCMETLAPSPEARYPRGSAAGGAGSWMPWWTAITSSA